MLRTKSQKMSLRTLFTAPSGAAFFCCLLLSMILSFAASAEPQYPQDNDADYYYNKYTPEDATSGTSDSGYYFQPQAKTPPVDNDAYYTEYYYGNEHSGQETPPVAPAHTAPPAQPQRRPIQQPAPRPMPVPGQHMPYVYQQQQQPQADPYYYPEGDYPRDNDEDYYPLYY